jgi:hypothetical protein
MSGSDVPTPTLDRSYWLQSLARAVFAVSVMAAVSLLGRSLHWPQPQAIASAVFFFIAFSTTPNRPGKTRRTLFSRVLSGLAAAAVGTLILAVLSNW